jgi:acetyl esterase/lipase
VLAQFAVALTVMQSSLGAAISPGPAPGSFYDPGPALHQGRPGTLIKTEPFGGAPAGAAAYKVLYRSTGLNGQTIAVSGIVIIPATPAPPGGREILAWAHPTTGIATRCAPSHLPDVYGTIPGLHDALRRGFVVTATDYPGLGTAGIHPYLVGISEGRAVLDSVRAARELPGTGVGPRFAVWGHSQGGHAALFTGELAASYAPDLRLVGIAAAAPPTQLATLVDDDIHSTAGAVLTAYTVWSWSGVYGINGADAMYPSAVPPVEEIGYRCIGTFGREYGIAQLEAQIQQKFLKIDPATTAPWSDLLVRNSAGHHPPGAPVFVAQGLVDDLVIPSVTLAYVDGLCRRGTPIRYLQLQDTDHAGSAEKGAGPAMEWIAARFAGQPAPTDCRG